MSRATPLADLIAPCLGKAVAKQGFASADIVASWPDIVGERLGALSMPIKVEWPRRPPDEGGQSRTNETRTPGTLIVRTASAAALELQHLAPVLIERVNGFYGWRCIGRLVLKQGPVGRPRPVRSPIHEIGTGERKRIDDAVAPIADDALRNALGRLGASVVTSTRHGGDEGHADATIPVA